MTSRPILAAVIVALMGMVFLSGCIGGTPPQNQTRQNQSNVTPGCICTMDYNPVCGTNGVTYGNACGAGCANVSVAYSGECAGAAPCADSDGGKDIFATGAVQAPAGTVSDACKSGAEVDEYYCEGNVPVKETLPCPSGYGCQGGACVAGDENASGSGCIDSDGGQSFGVSGNVKKEGATYTDYCTDLQLVKEYYCAGNEVSEQVQPCDSNERCMDGRCTEAERFCTDTDGGEDIYRKGTLNVGTIVASNTMIDTCEAGSLREYYCTGTTAHSSLASCPDYTECRNGACRETECTDTDDGQDRNEKGTATDVSISRTDGCASGTSVTEYYCSGSVVQSTTLACASGQVCSDGRCMAADTCSDSDGGWDVYSYGVATRGAVTSEDYCMASILTESYCEGPDIATQTFDCATEGGVCNYGACHITCTDSDGGFNTAGPAGTVTRGLESKTDYCVSAIDIREFYCDAEGNIAYTGVACAGTCESGACTG